MTDDEREKKAQEHREKRAADARRRRRKAREERAALIAATAAVTGAGVTWAALPRNALELHASQLSHYLIAMDLTPSVPLERRIALLCAALPSLARAIDATDTSQRLAELEREVMRRRGLHAV